MKKVFVCGLLVLASCGSSYYLQNAALEHLSPGNPPQLARQYRPNTLTISVSGGMSSGEAYRFNNGEHTKVNKEGVFVSDSFSINTFTFGGNNVGWNMDAFHFDFLALYDFAPAIGVLSQLSFGNVNQNFRYDLFTGAAFRATDGVMGFRAVLGGGLKDYRYAAEIAEASYTPGEANPGYWTSSLHRYGGYTRIGYLQTGCTISALVQSLAGVYVQGHYRYSPSVLSVPDTLFSNFGNSTVHLDPSEIVLGGGIFLALRRTTPFIGINFLFATNASGGAPPYPLYCIGLMRDFSFAHSSPYR